MKSEKVDLNNINQSNVGQVSAQMSNEPPKGSTMLDKSLLPSRGKFYTETIYVKKFNTLNIKNLATINENNINNVINNVLSSCLWGIDTSKILVGDKIWLIYYIRAFTYNDIPFNLRGTCEKCGNIKNYQFYLRNLDVTYLDKEIPEYIELPNKDKITLTFPTISTEGAINRLKNDQNIIIDINPELLELSSYILKVNDKKLSLYNAYEYVCEMDAMSFSHFTNEMSELLFSAKPVAKFTCPTCGEEIILPMPFLPSFFLPKIK
jgi:hypothetical protein